MTKREEKAIEVAKELINNEVNRDIYTTPDFVYEARQTEGLADAYIVIVDLGSLKNSGRIDRDCVLVVGGKPVAIKRYVLTKACEGAPLEYLMASSDIIFDNLNEKAQEALNIFFCD